MSIGLIGTKLGMTREFIQSGQSVPVTVIKIETGRVIDIIQKDDKGDPTRFKMTISLNVNTLSKNENEINKTKIFVSSFDYNNNSNKFTLKQYEKEIENILVNKVVEKSVIYLSEL